MSTPHDWTRGSIAGLAVVLAAPPPKEATAAALPDAELLALSARFDAQERACLEACRTDDDEEDVQDAVIDPLLDEQHSILDRMCDLRATTLDGLVARIRTIMLNDPSFVHRWTASTDCLPDRLMAAFLRDFTELAEVRTNHVTVAPALPADPGVKLSEQVNRFPQGTKTGST